MTKLRKQMLWGGLAFLTAFAGALTLASAALVVGIRPSLALVGAPATLGALIGSIGGWRALRPMAVRRGESCAY